MTVLASPDDPGISNNVAELAAALPPPSAGTRQPTERRETPVA